MKTTFKCPMCSHLLHSSPGHQLSNTDGVTVWCPNKQCPAQEVSGYGDNEKQAFKVVQHKFTNERD